MVGRPGDILHSQVSTALLAEQGPGAPLLGAVAGQ